MLPAISPVRQMFPRAIGAYGQGVMQAEAPISSVEAAEAALRTAREHHPLSVAALYWATVGSARATLAVVEELRRVREGKEQAPAREAMPAPTLGTREREILALLADGRTNAEIAVQVGLSPYTVKDHVSSLYRKLQARNRAEAVHRAQGCGLLD
jgi:DNA-binding NarL/FixJ family response regulator